MRKKNPKIKKLILDYRIEIHIGLRKKIRFFFFVPATVKQVL